MLSSFVTVLFAASTMAVPSPLAERAFPGFRPSPSPKGGCCSLSNFTLTDVAGLAVPSGPPSFIGVGLGTQNYTCTDAGTYTSAGAVADIFDIACLTSTPRFNTIQDEVLKNGAPRGVPLLGKHFFIANSAGGISPKWDFTKSQRNPNAFVVAKRDNGVPAPTGSQDVQWLQLSAVDGQLATTVYRTDTRLGQPPASCTPGSAPITVKYSSKYYFFGGSIKPVKQ